MLLAETLIPVCLCFCHVVDLFSGETTRDLQFLLFLIAGRFVCAFLGVRTNATAHLDMKKMFCFIILNLNHQIFFLPSQVHCIDTENRLYCNIY